MANITTKVGFIQYCLRKLGAPTINIEVTDDQIEDGYSDSLRMLQDFHTNGIERQYLKHQITQQDIDQGYIETPDSIIGVAKVLSFSANSTGGSSNYIFDLNYQIRMNDLWDLNSSSLSYYAAVRQYTSMLDSMLNGQPMYRFNRVQNRVFLDSSKSKISVGQWIVMECQRALTPEEFPELYMEPWFKKYTTALIKKQWGSNLKKYNGIQTIGGVVVDGQTIFDEALQEIKELEDELRNVFEEPLQFLVG